MSNGPLSPRLAGIPLVRNAAERDAIFPNPDTNQRVDNVATNTIQMWNGASWVDRYFAGSLATGTPAILVNGVQILAQAAAVDFIGSGVTGAAAGTEANITFAVGGGSTIAFQDEGSAIVSAGTANFVGAGVTVTNVAGVATITITSGGGVNPGTAGYLTRYDAAGTNVQNSPVRYINDLFPAGSTHVTNILWPEKGVECDGQISVYFDTDSDEGVNFSGRAGAGSAFSELGNLYFAVARVAGQGFPGTVRGDVWIKADNGFPATAGGGIFIGTAGSAFGDPAITVPHDQAHVEILPPLLMDVLAAPPAVLTNGLMWQTAAGVFARVAGATVGPFGTGGGGSTIAFQEEGAAVVTAGTANFVGSGVTVTNVAGVATITIPSGGGSVAWQDEGSAIVTAGTANFVGSGVTVTNVAGVATITIPGGGGAVSGTPLQHARFTAAGTDIENSNLLDVGTNVRLQDYAAVATFQSRRANGTAGAPTDIIDNQPVSAWETYGRINGTNPLGASLRVDSTATGFIPNPNIGARFVFALQSGNEAAALDRVEVRWGSFGPVAGTDGLIACGTNTKAWEGVYSRKFVVKSQQPVSLLLVDTELGGVYPNPGTAYGFLQTGFNKLRIKALTGVDEDGAFDVDFIAAGEAYVRPVITDVLRLGSASQRFKSIFLTAGTAALPPLDLGQGVAPTTPTNGQVWLTSAGMYARAGGVTAGPFAAAGGGSTIAFQDEGAAIVTAGTANFVGAGVVVTNVAGVATITIAGGGGSTIAFQEEGAAVVTAGTANFVGIGALVTNVAGVATITIKGLAGIPDLPATTGVVSATLIGVIDDPAGTPIAARATAAQLKTFMNIPAPAINGVVLFGGLLTPDGSGNCNWQVSSINNSNDLLPTTQVLRFANNGSVLIASYCDGVPVPSNYDGTTAVTVTIVWRTTATSGNVVWNARYRAVADGESNDPTTYQQSLAATEAAPATARLLKYSTLTMTAANLAANDTMLWMIGRDKSSGSDTVAADVEVVRVSWSY